VVLNSVAAVIQNCSFKNNSYATGVKLLKVNLNSITDSTFDNNLYSIFTSKIKTISISRCTFSNHGTFSIAVYFDPGPGQFARVEYSHFFDNNFTGAIVSWIQLVVNRSTFRNNTVRIPSNTYFTRGTLGLMVSLACVYLAFFLSSHYTSRPMP